MLTAADIESRPLWKPMHQQPVFAGARAFLRGDADRLFAAGLALPSGSALSSYRGRASTYANSVIPLRPCKPRNLESCLLTALRAHS